MKRLANEMCHHGIEVHLGKVVFFRFLDGFIFFDGFPPYYPKKTSASFHALALLPMISATVLNTETGSI